MNKKGSERTPIKIGKERSSLIEALKNTSSDEWFGKLSDEERNQLDKARSIEEMVRKTSFVIGGRIIIPQ